MKSQLFKLLNLVLIVVLFLKTSCLFSQQITGKVINGSGETLVKLSYATGLVIKRDSIHIKSGIFSKTFNFNEPKYITFQYSSFRKTIFVFPTAKIDISFNGTDQTKFNNSFKIRGDYEINCYIDSITTSNVYYNFISSKVNIKFPIDSFTEVLKDFRTFSDSLRQAFFPNSKSNKRIKALRDFLIIDSINWYSYSVLSAIDYVRIIPTGNKELFRQEEIEKRLILKPKNLYLVSDYYKRLWIFYLKGAFETGLKKTDSIQFRDKGFTKFVLEYLNSKNIQGRLKELIVSQLLNETLALYAYRSIEQNKLYDTLVTELSRMIHDENFLEEFSQFYSDNKKALLSHQLGKRAPDFTLIDTIGKKYTLKDFEGKIVLIDVWASWCGPCVKEFPYLRDLEKKFKNNKQFQLLSVSTDDSKQIWVENGLLRYRLPGLSLWVGEKRKFTRDYNIDFIPILLLLDHSGNFIDFNPPRASEGDKLYQLINEKLKQSSTIL